jgi:hypothetical protein
MYAMTTDAGGHFLISGLQQLAVEAGCVFLFLVHAQRRIKPLHEVSVIVTLATEGRDVNGSWSSQVSLARIFSRNFVVLSWVAAVTIVAGESSREMNIVLYRACRITDFALKLRMTFNTRILLLCAGAVCSQGQDESDEDPGR